MAHNQEATGLLRETSTEPATQKRPTLSQSTRARKSPNLCPTKMEGLSAKKRRIGGGFFFSKNKYCRYLNIMETKAVYCPRLVCGMKLLTSVVHIFYCQEFDWMFDLCDIQQREAVHNDLQESLSAETCAASLSAPPRLFQSTP